MKKCKECKIEKEITYFAPYSEPRKKGIRRNICYSCKGKKERLTRKTNPMREAKYKAYQSIYYKNNSWRGKVKSYQSSDRRKNLQSISSFQFQELLRKNKVCHYCEENDLRYIGLDRLDNNLGHEPDNVVLCCEKCNNILGDLPNSEKQVLRFPLKEIKDKGLLREWVIPTKRRKQS